MSQSGSSGDRCQDVDRVGDRYGDPLSSFKPFCPSEPLIEGLGLKPRLAAITIVVGLRRTHSGDNANQRFFNLLPASSLVEIEGGKCLSPLC